MTHENVNCAAVVSSGSAAGRRTVGSLCGDPLRLSEGLKLTKHKDRSRLFIADSSDNLWKVHKRTIVRRLTLHWVMLRDSKMRLSQKLGGGRFQFWQIYSRCKKKKKKSCTRRLQAVAAFTEVPLLHTSVGEVQNICYSFWKQLFLISAWHLHIKLHFSAKSKFLNNKKNKNLLKHSNQML